MNQEKRLAHLLDTLLREQPEYRDWVLPPGREDQKRLLRSLCNVRPPKPVSDEFLGIQDAYLQEEARARGITDIASLRPVCGNLYLWRGDITTLRVEAIVNAANARMLGCFVPCHGCIDNAIHSFSGLQLRLACDEQMRGQGRAAEPGHAMITPAYNLPSRYVLHTVGPIVTGPLRSKDRDLLAACYRSCLDLVEEKGIGSIAFCCISTGEYHFPQVTAAEIAIRTVQTHRAKTQSKVKVIFNVFEKSDEQIYRRLLGTDGPAAAGH